VQRRQLKGDSCRVKQEVAMGRNNIIHGIRVVMMKYLQKRGFFEEVSNWFQALSSP